MNNLRLYRWQALDQAGQLHHGELLADSRQAAYQQLFIQRLQPLKIRPRRRPAAGSQRQQLIAIMRQLATLLQAGLPLIGSLQLLAEEQHEPFWRCILQNMARQLEQGESFSSTIAHYQPPFPTLCSPLVAVGELTGQLEQCCWRLAQQQEQRERLHRKVSKALRYPLFICLLAAAICLLMLLFVLPEFAKIYRSFDAALPWFTRRLLALADGLAATGAYLLTGAVLAAGLYRRRLRHSPRWRRRQEWLLLHLPLVGQLVRGNCLSQIFYTLTVMQQSGLPLLQSLEVSAQALNSPAYRRLLDHIRQEVAQGTPFHAAVGQNALFPPLCQQLIRIGEESGTLDTLLGRLAEWHEQQTHELADGLTQTLEPTLMVVVGVIVGALLIAMYLPIFQLGNVLA